MHITQAHTDIARHARPGPFPPRGHPLPGRDTEFIALQDAYRHSGGLARGESLAQRMSLAGTGGYVDLARRIVGGQLFSFQWHDDFWLPMFQFDPQGLAPREAPRRVLAELRGALDGWAIAHWYLAPSQVLDGRAPLDLLDTAMPAVLEAARSARGDALRGAGPA
jgi:Protein of unknown function (DUF2384)